MAGLPLKSGADFYNLEAARLRLHNLGADPTEVGAGLIYFNTSSGLNTSQKARLYTGSAWKTIAFSEDLDVASNADFLALKERVDLLSGDVDTDNLINNLKDLEEFLKDFDETDKLKSLLDGKLNTSGGILGGNLYIGAADNTSYLYQMYRRGGHGFRINSTGSNAYMAFGELDSAGKDLIAEKVLEFGDSGFRYSSDGGSTYNAILTSAGGTIDGSILIGKNDNTEYKYLRITRVGNVVELTTTGSNGQLMYNGVGFSFNETQALWNSNTLIHEGNYSDFALPLSGGTIEGLLEIKRDISIIRFTEGSTICGYLGVHGKNNPTFMTTDGTGYTLLHSGNVGDYAVKGLNIQTSSDNTRSLFSVWRGNTDADGGDGYVMDFNWNSGNYKAQIYIDVDPTHKMALRQCGNDGKWSDWKTIAFTDSDITGNAAGLYNKQASVGNYYIKPYAYGFSLEGQYATLRIKTTNIYNSQIEFADNNDIVRWSLSYRGTNKADKDFYFTKINEGGEGNDIMALNYSSGYVGIGTTNPSARLDVNGNILMPNYSALMSRKTGGTAINLIYCGNDDVIKIGGILPIKLQGNTTIGGDLHVTGNIIADGEVSAGGAAEEGGNAGGGGAFHSESIAVGATQTTIAHGLGTDDIVVSIYEKDGVSGRWSIILTDVEIVDANNIIVSFGSATSVEHKVVIMGAVA
jgi:hypothetical protein